MSPQELQNRLLALRGVAADEQSKFLSPSYENLADPLLLHDMDKAVERVCAAWRASEHIVLYADYDADGIPGAVVLHDFFKKIGYANVSVYIPHRHTEGYGFHIDAIEQCKAKGATLIITIDVGTVAHEGIRRARELGIDVIVCDHHEPVGELPDAYAIVNPKLGTYPDRMLCGCAVAFRFVQALVPKFPEHIVPGWEKWLLDMVGIATLSDMVPLISENRIFASFGLKVLRKTNRPGLRALFRASRIKQEHLIEDDIVFSVTPRLNAASRMSDPREAFELLTTTDASRADALAEHLASLTEKRKTETARIMRSIHAKLKERTIGPVIVIGDPGWGHGVLGLVASKVCETYGASCFVWSADGDIIRGSCRTVGNASAVKLMQHAHDALLQFGGHDGAGGFTTTREHMHVLEERLAHAYQAHGFLNGAREPLVHHDMMIPFDSITHDHWSALRALAPFGQGNKVPVFLIENVRIVALKQFGKKSEHLEVVVSDGMRSKKGIAFFTRADAYVVPIAEGQSRDILASFDLSYFTGSPELRLRIVDIR